MGCLQEMLLPIDRTKDYKMKRKIERACRENVTFMALSYGQCPDHSTIAAFVSSMRDEILPLCRDVLLVWEEMDL